jgi:hypothetical protein
MATITISAMWAKAYMRFLKDIDVQALCEYNSESDTITFTVAEEDEIRTREWNPRHYAKYMERRTK